MAAGAGEDVGFGHPEGEPGGESDVDDADEQPVVGRDAVVGGLCEGAAFAQLPAAVELEAAEQDDDQEDRVGRQDEQQRRAGAPKPTNHIQGAIAAIARPPSSGTTGSRLKRLTRKPT